MNETKLKLHEKLSHLQWLLHHQHLRDCAAGGPLADTTRGQGRILSLLKMQDGLSTKDLSYLLGLQVSSLNELLAKLEKSGYVAREPAESDKRVILVKLTDQGRNASAQKNDGEDIFHCLNEEEQATFDQYLDRVIAALEDGFTDGPEDKGDWLRAARSRLGDKMFDRLETMKHGHHHHDRNGHGFHDRDSHVGGFHYGRSYRGGGPHHDHGQIHDDQGRGHDDQSQSRVPDAQGGCRRRGQYCQECGHRLDCPAAC
jgi:DNA-binding MarR family transcriptional regulator